MRPLIRQASSASPKYGRRAVRPLNTAGEQCVQAFLGSRALALSNADWRQLPYIIGALMVASMWSWLLFYASCRFRNRPHFGATSPPCSPRRAPSGGFMREVVSLFHYQYPAVS